MSLTQVSDIARLGSVALSVDLFDTLLVRGRTRDTSFAVFEPVAERYGPSPRIGGPKSVFRSITRRLAAQLIDEGRDPEIPRRLLMREALAHFWRRPPTERELDELCEQEFAFIQNATARCDAVHRLMVARRSAGGRVIVISDTRLSGEDIVRLLSFHGITEFDAVYASSDFGASKFRGGLYERVKETEQREADGLAHLGDNKLSDVWSARRAGIWSCHFKAPTVPEDSAVAAFAYDLGYSELGRVFAGFAELLLEEARRRSVQQLAFLARDGQFLMEITVRLAAALSETSGLRLRYAHISRRSALLASRDRLTEADIREALYVRTPGSPMRRVISYFNVDPDAIDSLLETMGYESLDTVTDQQAIIRILNEPLFERLVLDQHRQQRELLESYLASLDFFSLETALVDVGWRGSIQAALQGAFPVQFGAKPLHGLYMGYWTETGLRRNMDSCVGLISDIRRRRTTVEGSAWYLSALIEAVCRSDEGTTLGYKRDVHGRVVPVLATDGRAWDAERATRMTADAVRQGVRDYIDHYSRYRSQRPDFNTLRIDLQKRMRRLAFFPSPEEITVGMHLMHTESHAKDWSVPLVAAESPCPLVHPLKWMRGLQSPWRGAYVMATAGFAGASAIIAAEASMLSLPSEFRQALRTVALALSRADRF